MTARLRIQLCDYRQRLAFTAEVRNGLAGSSDGQVRDEVPDPRADRQHDHLCFELVERLDLRLLFETGAARQRAVDESSVREVGTHDAGLGLEQCRPPVGHAERPAASCFLGFE